MKAQRIRSDVDFGGLFPELWLLAFANVIDSGSVDYYMNCLLTWAYSDHQVMHWHAATYITVWYVRRFESVLHEVLCQESQRKVLIIEVFDVHI